MCELEKPGLWNSLCVACLVILEDQTNSERRNEEEEMKMKMKRKKEAGISLCPERWKEDLSLKRENVSVAIFYDERK